VWGRASYRSEVAPDNANIVGRSTPLEHPCQILYSSLVYLFFPINLTTHPSTLG